MHLKEEESILKIYHHHPSPFVFQLFKVIVATFPFLLMLFLLKNALSSRLYIIMHLVVLFIFSLVVTYLALVYWLDKLVITNQRVVYVNWKYLTVRVESEAFLHDIQDIQSQERGIFSYFWIFDFGRITIETASAHTIVFFDNAPDPEAIRQYIYNVRSQ